MKNEFIPLAQHPSNLDPSAKLVSGGREEISIFQVRGGYVAARAGLAAYRLFPSEQAARRALGVA